MSEHPHPDDWQAVADAVHTYPVSFQDIARAQTAARGFEPSEGLATPTDLPSYEQLNPRNELSDLMDELGSREYVSFEDFNDTDIRDVVKGGDYSSVQLGNLALSLQEMTTRDTSNAEHSRVEGDSQRYLTALECLSLAPDEQLRSIYFNADAPGSLAVREMLRANTEGIISYTLGKNMLLRLHGIDDMISLKYDPGLHQEDPLVQDFVDRPDYPGLVIEEMWEDFSLMAEPEAAEGNKHTRHFQDRYLRNVVGLSKELSNDFQFVTLGRTSTAKGSVDRLELQRQLEHVHRLAETFGPRTLDLLHQKAGITNLDAYSESMIARMTQTLLGDPEMVEHLKIGDTTVVMRDSKGDYAGALFNDERTFDTPAGRTLMFEINQPSDFYRHMSLLNEIGIKPSTLVISTHGMPGEIAFGSRHRGITFSVNNSLSSKPNQLSITKSPGLSRMVRDYMQPSRAVNDDPANIGRRRIVIAACNSDVQQNVLRKDGDTIYDKKATLVETLTETIGHPELDVYGSSGEIGVAKEETKILFGDPDDENKTLARQQKISKVSLDSRGRTVRSYVDTIQLEPDKEADHVSA